MLYQFVISFIVFSALLSSCSSVKSLDTIPTSKTIVQGSVGSHLDSLLTPYIIGLREKTNNTTGLSIGVTKGSKIIYARSFGYAKLETSTEADFSTRYNIASLSKPFTAAVIVKLAELGKLNLNDKVVNHLPEFNMKDPRCLDVTIQHILSHTSGLPRHVSNDDWENPVYGQAAIDKTLNDFKAFELDFDPGSEFRYSNSAFDLLGVLINRVSGMTFEDCVTKYILKPSGMVNSEYSKPNDRFPKNWAGSYSYGLESQEWTPYPYAENGFPSSGLQTTLLDMCNWGMLYVNNGKHQHNVVIKEEFFSLLTTPSFDTPWGDKMGLSWFLQSYMERPIIMHQGNVTGFESIIYIYPEDSISITIMANRDFARTGRMINATSEILFGQQAKEYSVSAKYLFTKTYQKSGISAAIELWDNLKKDTTDRYYVDDEDILTTGAVLENGKKWQETKDVLEFYISLDRQSTYAWRLLGNAYLGLGNKEAAQKCYEETLRINPDYSKGKKALEDLLKK
ncbi:MAG: serine hydrolase [Crocinitomicaceae bacterium]